MADLGVWTVDGDAPRRVSKSGVGLERNLEDWIANDSSLLADRLTIVGRQVRLEGGPLDLLAIDGQDRWTVIELKRERLYRDALAQALDYASSIATMDGEDLQALLQPGFAAFGDAQELAQTVRQQLDAEEGSREVAVLLAGVGAHAGLERIVDHLLGYGVPISIVSFEVFEPDGGPRLLIREVTEEQTGAPLRRRRWRTLDDIRQLAVEAGVAGQFERFVQMSDQAGLDVRAYKVAAATVPKRNRARTLIYAKPTSGRIFLEANPAAIAEFLPPLTEEQATAAIGSHADTRGYFEGADLDARLDQIEALLQTVPRGDRDGDED